MVTVVVRPISNVFQELNALSGRVLLGFSQILAGSDTGGRWRRLRAAAHTHLPHCKTESISLVKNWVTEVKHKSRRQVALVLPDIHAIEGSHYNDYLLRYVNEKIRTTFIRGYKAMSPLPTKWLNFTTFLRIAERPFRPTTKYYHDKHIIRWWLMFKGKYVNKRD